MSLQISKKWIINIAAFALILILSAISIRSCSNLNKLKKESSNNIEALTDSLECYKDANGNLVAEKKILVCEYDDIKTAYKNLYDELSSLKIKNASLAAEIKMMIDNPKIEIHWKTDTIMAPYNMKLPFLEKNDFRTLSGFVGINNTDVSLNIDEDKVYIDYTFVVKDNTIYIKTTNPYAVFNDVNGYKLPETKKQRHFGFGVYAGFGMQYGLINKTLDLGPQIGGGIVYLF